MKKAILFLMLAGLNNLISAISEHQINNTTIILHANSNKSQLSAKEYRLARKLMKLAPINKRNEQAIIHMTNDPEILKSLQTQYPHRIETKLISKDGHDVRYTLTAIYPVKKSFN